MSQLSSQRMKVPLEILREIVEIAFLFNYTTGPVLALTCKSINAWITPLLYSSVSLNKENILPFIRGVESAQCGTLDTGSYVKKLCFRWDAMKHCDWTLLHCRSVTQLLVYTHGHDYDIDERITDTSLWPKPWHVMVLCLFPSWILPRRELFTHTTHYTLYIEESLLPPILSLCATMPLTHACFNIPAELFLIPDDDEDDEIILGHLNPVHFFLGLPAMQCVLIHAFSEAPFADFSGRIWRSLAGIIDERFIVAPWIARDELIEAFEEGRTVWDNIADWKTWRQMARLQIL